VGLLFKDWWFNNRFVSLISLLFINFLITLIRSIQLRHIAVPWALHHIWLKTFFPMMFLGLALKGLIFG
jgi:hypothetical protein